MRLWMISYNILLEYSMGETSVSYFIGCNFSWIKILDLTEHFKTHTHTFLLPPTGKLGILSSQNETEGHDVVFVCPVVTGTVSEHRWLINGSLSSSFSDVKDTISAGEIQLYFSQVSSKYNHTTIQCVVTFTSGKTEDSNNATLRGTYYDICGSSCYNYCYSTYHGLA